MQKDSLIHLVAEAQATLTLRIDPGVWRSVERKLTLRDFGHEIIKKDLHLDPFKLKMKF